jgi:sigma-E factor negative regulatory protein RseA
MRRYAITGGAAFAVAAIALMSTPQLTVATKDRVSPTNMSTMMASSGRTTGPLAVASNALPVAVAGGTGYGTVVLRDPRIDEYLLAHQRFSPSLYSTAQYARSATFATDSDN